MLDVATQSPVVLVSAAISKIGAPARPGPEVVQVEPLHRVFVVTIQIWTCRTPLSSSFAVTSRFNGPTFVDNLPVCAVPPALVATVAPFCGATPSVIPGGVESVLGIATPHEELFVVQAVSTTTATDASKAALSADLRTIDKESTH